MAKWAVSKGNQTPLIGDPNSISKYDPPQSLIGLWTLFFFIREDRPFPVHPQSLITAEEAPYCARQRWRERTGLQSPLPFRSGKAVTWHLRVFTKHDPPIGQLWSLFHHPRCFCHLIWVRGRRGGAPEAFASSFVS